MSHLALVPVTADADAEPKARKPHRDRAARDALVKANLGLVYTIANDFARGVGRYIPVEDLVGYGSVGLIEAAERFDESAGLPFGMFARYRIRGAILDGVRSQGTSPNGLTYPRGAYKQIAAEERVNRLLEQEARKHHGEVTSPDDALAYFDDVLTKIARIHVLAAVDDDDGCGESVREEMRSTGNRWGRQPLMPAVEPPLDGLTVRAAMKVLTPKQRRLIELVYGQDMDLFEAARELGIASGTVTKLHQRALAALRAVIVQDDVR